MQASVCSGQDLVSCRWTVGGLTVLRWKGGCLSFKVLRDRDLFTITQVNITRRLHSPAKIEKRATLHIEIVDSLFPVCHISPNMKQLFFVLVLVKQHREV